MEKTKTIALTVIKNLIAFPYLSGHHWNRNWSNMLRIKKKNAEISAILINNKPKTVIIFKAMAFRF